MSNLGFQTVYRLFNAQDDIVCERVLPAAEAGTGRAARGEGAAADARIADAGRRLRRLRVLGVLRMGLRERADAAAPRRHPALRRRAQPRAIRSIVIGGAVTFVNPEPLAPFADVIAAGEGEALVPALRARVRGGDRSRRPAAAARRASAASTSRRSTSRSTRADGTLAGYSTMPGVDAPCRSGRRR